MQLEIPFYLFVLLLGCLLINFGQKGIVNNHEGVSDLPQKSVPMVYGAMLLAFRGGGGGSNLQKNSVT